jgi:THO complex subunit 4
VLDASSAPAPPAAKSLGERVAYAKTTKSCSSALLTKTSANPKAQPKSATATKGTANGTGKKAANKAKKQGKNATRSKPKTAEELDAEMTDYFTNNNGGATTMTDANGAASGNAQSAATGGEDLGMDEISVSSSVEFIT